MAGFKETPRQKMIAMMYLVLTALLALNVSVEILNAFIVVNESIEDTNSKFKAKVDQTYVEFAKQFSINPEKTKDYYNDAIAVQTEADAFVEYIESIKLQAILKNERKSIEELPSLELKDLRSKDKFDMVTKYFIGTSEKNDNGEAYVLSAKMDVLRTNLLGYFPEGTTKDIGLLTNKQADGSDKVYRDRDNKKQSWEMHNFYHTILAADITILNKIIAEVRGAEYDVVNYLFSNITKEDLKFTDVKAMVIPKSDYVLLGDNYEATVIVAAYDTLTNPDIKLRNGTKEWKSTYLDNSADVPVEAGFGEIKQKATTEGLKSYSGVVVVKDPNTGIEKFYPYEGEYTVAKPSLTVSATKMNVFYMGVPNPVSISVPGVPASRLAANVTKGLIKKADNGQWVVTMPAGSEGDVDVVVSASVDGKTKGMGKSPFRVKRLPTPTATVANSDGGPISKSRLNAVSAIIPTMPQDFDFEANFTITRYKMVTLTGGDIIEEQGTGNVINPRMKGIIKNLKRGQKIWFEDIFAKGPDGTTRRLNTISLTLN